MADKSSLRIDWFDGTLIENARHSANTSQFEDEEVAEPQTKKQEVEKKPIGFKRLLDLSLLKPPVLNLEISNRPGFWHLLDTDLKGDFIVLIVKIFSNIYKSLEIDEKSKIVKLIRTRFIKSLFVSNLKKYIEGLPKVRIVEKKMNMQLWDDVETFFFNMYELINGMFKFHASDMEIFLELLELVQLTESSALGVIEEHTETIRDNLLTQIDQLKNNLLRIINQVSENNEFSSNIEQCNKDPTYFRNLQIFPTKDDILSDDKVKIEPNIINGGYVSVENYLDVQFKLLREDCFAPLREGICNYIKDPSKRRHENIRVYPKVRMIRTYVSNNKVGHLVDIAWQERLDNGNIDKKQLAYSKRLIFGSLLLFTCDQFETVLCASVLDSNSNLLREGYIVVQFETPVSNKIYTEPYLMVESEVFFEPYHRVLKVLQNIRFDDLPMKRYIVDVQTEPQPPIYLSSDTMYSVLDPNNREEIGFPVLDYTQWPTKELFGLDESQMDAFHFALTRQFAVIQGPPGTGKTFVGVKIASTLLKNLSLEGTPMLIICYTNHALDQFLEEIINVTDNVIRLGSQSKSKILQNYTLSKMRGRTKSKYSYLYSNKRAELERIYKEMTEVQTEIDKCEREIVSYRSLKPYLKIGDQNYELKTTNEDSVVSWLFSHLEEELEEVEEELEDWEKEYEDVSISDVVETVFSEESALKVIESMTSSIKYVKDITEDEKESKKMKEKFEEQIVRIRKRLDYFKKMMASRKMKSSKKSIQKVKDLYELTPERRWNFYFSVTDALKDKLITKMNDLMVQYNTCGEEMEEVRTLLDGEIVRSARVVGVTTSAAARRHDLLRKLLSPIVLVEEAAEVLEGHIVASLTNSCQHLILIGDHKQLRPTAAHYRLAKDFNLEISLFERMIRNGVHARTLTMQRRMRSQVAQLLVPEVYSQLDTHPSTLTYPDVRGMRDNLYFFSHNVFEDTEGLEDSWSHRNSYEANWCLALANYLRRLAYKSNEITLLATYNGQAALLRDLSRRYELLRDMKITVVDNYQGEENRIVILSLVRSNRDGKIGFLSARNRICVAMSRAREGFYIFGNMDMLRDASQTWRSIGDKMKAQNVLGKKIFLKCEKHKHSIVTVESYHELEDCIASDGVCLKHCNLHK
ncbi:NFX1-type zinc finger-containing protein 1 [Battus philenor]|uniref:NFX1-type zinc finger-containing protein 1 n=1 Tax=Battus philenor TaxID=42288 RepID=UPI0035D0BC66